MRNLLSDIDGLLRGRKTRPEALADGTDQLLVRRHLPLVVTFGAIYGVAMGLYVAITRDPGTTAQFLSSALKVPLVYLLSLVVTLPSFLVFGALLGVRLGPRDAVRVIVSAILVNLVVLASFAPVTAFFTVCTTSYAFLKLLSMVFFMVSGIVGIGFLGRLVGNLEKTRRPPPEEPKPEPPKEPDLSLPVELTDAEVRKVQARLETRPVVVRRASPDEMLTSRRLLRVWVILYVLVAAQMVWLLRPLIGSPDEAFAWLKLDERGGSFLLDFGRTLADLLKP